MLHLQTLAVSAAAMLLALPLLSCSGSDDTGDTAVQEHDSAEPEQERVGFEILHLVSATEIIVWIHFDELTIEDFEALELDDGWLKNEPREGVPDGSSFDRSPTETESGVFTAEEHYGYEWIHNATVIDPQVQIDDEGLLTGSIVHKYHTIEYSTARSVSVIVSPEGDHYILVSRDAERTQEVPTIPPSWQTLEVELTETLAIELPEYTTVIRADNEDSFQGPLTASQVGL